MNRTCFIGVVGLGYWGPNLARNFHELHGCRLTALCDKDPDRLEKVRRSYPHTQPFANIHALLATPHLDAIVVATPAPQHFSIAKAALLAGKHVLIEKPMASSVAECEELIELAHTRCLTLMVGHIFLYSAAVQAIQKLISSGELGKILYINSQRLNLGLFHNDINVVWDLAPHDISIVLHLLGQSPSFVNCQGHANITPGIVDVSNLSLSFEGGQFASIQSSWLEPRKARRMTIVGTRQMVIYDDIESLEKIRIYNTRIERPPHYDSYAEFQFSYHYGDCHIPRIEQVEPLRRMCQHFLDSCKDRTPPLTNGENGLEVVRILEASSKSLKARGAAVSLSHSPAASESLPIIV